MSWRSQQDCQRTWHLSKVSTGEGIAEIVDGRRESKELKETRSASETKDGRYRAERGMWLGAWSWGRGERAPHQVLNCNLYRVDSGSSLHLWDRAVTCCEIIQAWNAQDGEGDPCSQETCSQLWRRGRWEVWDGDGGWGTQSHLGFTSVHGWASVLRGPISLTCPSSSSLAPQNWRCGKNRQLGQLLAWSKRASGEAGGPLPVQKGIISV